MLNIYGIQLAKNIIQTQDITRSTNKENLSSMIFREGFQIGYKEDENELYKQLESLNGV